MRANLKQNKHKCSTNKWFYFISICSTAQYRESEFIVRLQYFYIIKVLFY